MKHKNSLSFISFQFVGAKRSEWVSVATAMIPDFMISFFLYICLTSMQVRAAHYLTSTSPDSPIMSHVIRALAVTVLSHPFLFCSFPGSPDNHSHNIYPFICRDPLRFCSWDTVLYSTLRPKVFIYLPFRVFFRWIFLQGNSVF